MSTSNHPSDLDVAIVGGGVAGAATACAFAQAGCRVVMFERRPLQLDANRGDALHAEVAALLERWGAMHEFERRGAFWVRQMCLTTRRDAPKVTFPLDRAPLLVLAHAEIELSLSTVARHTGALVEGRRVTRIERDGTRWLICAGERQFTARLLVGADGAGSLVRRTVGIPVDRHEYGQATIVMHARRPDWLAGDLMWVLAHPEGGVLVLPTTPKGCCRVVVQVKEHELADWREQSALRLNERLATRHARLGELELLDERGSHIYRLLRQHAERYVSGTCALVGDAAHVTHPNGGQGMAMALRDADELSRLAVPTLAAEKDDGRIQAALWEYAARRRPACARAIKRADRVARLQNGTRGVYAAAHVGLGLLSLTPTVAARQFQRFGGS